MVLFEQLHQMINQQWQLKEDINYVEFAIFGGGLFSEKKKKIQTFPNDNSVRKDWIPE